MKYEQNQVKENEGHEDDLGNKVTHDVQLLPEEHVIPKAHCNTEQHVNNADDDRYFHFVRVQEIDLVFSDLR